MQSRPGLVLQWVALLLSPNASWWACLAGDAGLTSAGACWVLEIHVNNLHEREFFPQRTDEKILLV